MSEPPARGAARCHHDSPYCAHCDLLVGLDSLHVLAVMHDEKRQRLRGVVESQPAPMGCSSCDVIAHSHGRREVTLIDAPCFGCPVQVIRRKRTRRCVEPLCPTGSFTEQDEQIAAPRALMSVHGLIELHRRIARGFRNRENYRPRMLLIAGGLDTVIPT